MLLQYPLHSNAREVTNLPRYITRCRISLNLIRLQAWFGGERDKRLDRNVLDSYDVYKEVHKSHPDKTDYQRRVSGMRTIACISRWEGLLLGTWEQPSIWVCGDLEPCPLGWAWWWVCGDWPGTFSSLKIWILCPWGLHRHWGLLEWAWHLVLHELAWVWNRFAAQFYNSWLGG